MTTFLAIAGLALLFVVFGAFRPGAKGTCGDCSCAEGTCQLEEEEASDLHHS
jgi:hypothetical protein